MSQTAQAGAEPGPHSLGDPVAWSAHAPLSHPSSPTATAFLPSEPLLLTHTPRLTPTLPPPLPARPRPAICVLLFAKDAWWGWQHKRRRTLAASTPSMGLCGAAALALAAGLMLTDMSALGEVALPDNPGAVFKSPDVAYRSSVWSKWGYGQVQMRL